MLVRASGASQTARSSPGLWISDDLLRLSFERFAATTLAAAAASSKTVSRTCIRHGSSVPGPLESRRRLLRRRLTDSTLASQTHNSIPVQCSPSLFTLYRHIWPDLSLPRVRWQPPSSDVIPVLPNMPAPSRFSWWQDPASAEHPTHKPFNPSSDSKSADFLKAYCSRLIKLSVSEYSQLLYDCGSFVEIKQLHYDKANALLDAPSCSSLAFQHLLTIRSALDAKNLEQTVSVDQIVDFLGDPKLEHTRGSNLARLISQLSLADASNPCYASVFNLVHNGLQHNLFSLQALAALHRHVPKLEQMASTALSVCNLDISSTIIARFQQQISALDGNQVSSCSLTDLTSLVHMANTLSDPLHVASLTRLVLDGTLQGIQSGDIALAQLPSLLHGILPLVQTSKGILQPVSTVATLREIWRLQQKSTGNNPDKAELLVPLLKLTNHLPACKATVVLTSDLIQGYALHQSNTALTIHHESAVQRALTQAAMNMLFFDNLQPRSASRVYPSRLVSLIKPYESTDANAEQNNSQSMSSLTSLMDRLPTIFAEAWLSHTSKSIARLLEENKTKENLNLLNSWLAAAAQSKVFGIVPNSSAWAAVFEHISVVARPAELASFFRILRNGSICRLLVRHWFPKDAQLVPSIVIPTRDIGFSQPSTAVFRKVLSDGTGPYKQDHAQLSPALDSSVYQFVQTVRELESRWVQITLGSLETIYDCFAFQPSRQAYYASSSARCFVCVLQSVAVLGLPVQQVLRDLLELTHWLNRPVVFTALADVMTTSPHGPRLAQQQVMTRQIAKYCFSNPGLSFRLFKRLRFRGIWDQKDLLAALILSPKSVVRPQVILQQLCKEVPEAGLVTTQDGFTDGGSLGEQRIDAIHDAAIYFATGARMSSPMAWEYVNKLLSYLQLHKAPLDRRISKAIVITGLLRALTDPLALTIPKDILDVCSRTVAQVEGTEAAEAVIRLEYIWERQKASLGADLSNKYL